MDCRLAKDEELKEIKDIWKYCFNDSDEFMNYYFDNKYNKNNSIIVKDKVVVAALQLNQYKMKLNNKVYDASYVVGVSTSPIARGNGYMKVLMKQALLEMYNRGQLISILMPIDYRLYRHYGFEHCYDCVEYKLDVNFLKENKLNGKFAFVNDDNLGNLKKIYGNCMQDYNGYILRDDNYYKNLIKELKTENGNIYMHETDDVYDGYIIYSIENGSMFVRELVYENIMCLKSFLKFIYNHNTQVKEIIINVPLSNKINLLMDNLKDINIRIKPFMMGRIINVKKFLESIEIQQNIIESKIIKIEDTYIEENNKTFKITIKDNKIDILETQEDCDIQININVLSQLAFSYIDVYDFIFMMGNKVNNKDIYCFLEKIFAKKINYINEYI